MLGALIVHLTDRRRAAAVPPPVAAALRIVRCEVRGLRLWVEDPDAGACTLQLFCPEWTLPHAGTIALEVHGEACAVELAAGQDLSTTALALARALDRSFDVTLPDLAAGGQRLALRLAAKHRADLAAASTDGLVLVRSDGLGLDLEVGLDGPGAAGGVVSVELGARCQRFATRPGQHGAEVAQRLAAALECLGAVVQVLARGEQDSFRARINLIAVHAHRAAA